MSPIEIIFLCSILVLFLIGTPLVVAFSVGSVAILIYSMGLPYGNVAQLFFQAVNSYPMLAMPFFIFAGNIIMRTAGIKHLSNFLRCSFGQTPGGMAGAIIIFSAFLGAISGSASACLAIIGTIFVPMLVTSGYPRPFAAGVAVTSAGLGAVIPPSIFFIVFGSSNRIPIGELFIGGIGPGFLAAVLMVIVAVVISRRRGYSKTFSVTKKEKSESFIKSLPVVFMPVIVLGGIYSGIFSPTQAGAVAVFYCLGLALLVYRDFSFADFNAALMATVKLSSMIYFLVVGGELFGKVLGYIGLPQLISEVVIRMDLGPVTFLLAVQLLLIVMGFFFSSFPMVVIVLPLFLPSVYSLGIDPVHYGALAIFCAIIGEATPPMGPQLWIAASVCREKIGSIMRESWIFLGVQIFTLFIVTLFPQICLYPVQFLR